MPPWQACVSAASEEGLGDVVDVSQVPQLLSAPDLEGLALDHAADPQAEEILARVAHPQSRAVAIGQAQRHNRPLMDPVLQHPELLAGELGDAVGVRRGDRMVLVHGQVLGAAVELPRRGVDHEGVGRGLARGVDQAQLGRGVDGEVGERVALSAHVARLGRQVEDHVHTLAQDA